MGNKTLNECEEHLEDIRGRLKAILLEQEEAVKEWNSFPEQYEDLVMAKALEIRQKVLAR